WGRRRHLRRQTEDRPGGGGADVAEVGGPGGQVGVARAGQAGGELLGGLDDGPGGGGAVAPPADGGRAQRPVTGQGRLGPEDVGRVAGGVARRRLEVRRHRVEGGVDGGARQHGPRRGAALVQIERLAAADRRPPDGGPRRGGDAPQRSHGAARSVASRSTASSASSPRPRITSRSPRRTSSVSRRSTDVASTSAPFFATVTVARKPAAASAKAAAGRAWRPRVVATSTTRSACTARRGPAPAGLMASSPW